VAAQARHSYAFNHPRKSSHHYSNKSRNSSDDSSDKPEEAEEEQSTQYGGNDEYVDALKEISGKYPASMLKKGQREARKRDFIPDPKETLEAMKNMEKHEGNSLGLETQGELMAMARYGMKSNDMEDVLNGAKIYEKLGQGGRASVKRRLIRGFEKGLRTAKEKYEKLYKNSGEKLYSWDYDKDPSLFVNRYAPEIEVFLKKNPTLRSTTLEKTVATASIAGVLSGLFFLSAKITGNAIGNQSLQSSSVIGVILIILGVIAGYLWMKNRKTAKGANLKVTDKKRSKKKKL
jgi:hypothetical protein